MIRLLAKLMWLMPALLLFYSLYLVQAGFDQKKTWEDGYKTIAEVTNVQVDQRSEITYGEIELSFEDEEGAEVVESMPLPLSLLFMVKDEASLPITYNASSSKPVTIDRVARALWKLSMINAAICLFAGLLLIIPVFAWNRYLKKHGDPGELATESVT